jgi:hypothetical protein
MSGSTKKTAADRVLDVMNPRRLGAIDSDSSEVPMTRRRSNVHEVHNQSEIGLTAQYRHDAGIHPRGTVFRIVVTKWAVNEIDAENGGISAYEGMGRLAQDSQ